jgi:hypothetical protein
VSVPKTSTAMRIQLTDERRERMLRSIKKYFAETSDQELGDPRRSACSSSS